MNLRARAMTLLACLATPVLLAACSKGGGPSEVAATVEGRTVAAADVERLTRSWMSSQMRQGAEDRARQSAERQAGGALPAGPGSEQLDEDEVERLVLAYLIRRTLLDELAAEREIKVDLDSDTVEAVRSAPDDALAASGWGGPDIEGSLEAGEISKALAEAQFPDVDVSEEEIRKRYEAQPELFARSWKAKVQSASFASADAVEAVREAVAGGERFADAASRLGALEQLDLGTVNSARSLPQEIRDALDQVSAGGVSKPVPVGDQFLGLFVAEREDLPALSLDEVRDELATQIKDEKRQELFDKWFDKQLRRAKVRVDDHFGEWDRKSSQVV